MKLKLHEYKFDDNFSVLEIKNDGRRIDKVMNGIIIPNYEYHLIMRMNGIEKDEFIFGCDCLMMDNIFVDGFRIF